MSDVGSPFILWLLNVAIIVFLICGMVFFIAAVVYFLTETIGDTMLWYRITEWFKGFKNKRRRNNSGNKNNNSNA